MRFEPKYSTYVVRVFKEAFMILLICIIMLLLGLIYKNISLIILTIIFIPIGLLLAFKKNKHYLKSIEFDEDKIEIVAYKLNKLCFNKESNLSNVKIVIEDLVLAYYPRKFKLQIETLEDGKYRTLITQYEVGNWDLILFKEVYSEYCKIKEIPINLSAIKRSNF